MQIADIFEKVKWENARSVNKYGYWRDTPVDGQQDAISRELKERTDAIEAGDIHGEHGEISESLHCINVLCRRIMFLTGEPNA